VSGGLIRALCAFLIWDEATYNAAMENSQTPSSVSVEIIPASPEQEPIVAHLLELYAHDFSEFIDLKLGADGRFGYEHLPLYWKESHRYPFLITVNSHLAGFVFVRRGSQISNDENVWDMAEFFVVRGSRRLGIGTKVAHHVWRKFPGKWEVRVIDRNQRAKEFWEVPFPELTGIHRTQSKLPFSFLLFSLS
jgi:predicted acetyltransferase